MSNEALFVFDFNRITYREILELDLEDEDDSKTSEETIQLIVQVLTKWPYEAEPSVDAILDLGLNHFAALQNAFSEAMDTVFKKSD